MANVGRTTWSLGWCAPTLPLSNLRLLTVRARLEIGVEINKGGASEGDRGCFLANTTLSLTTTAIDITIVPSYMIVELHVKVPTHQRLARSDAAECRLSCFSDVEVIDCEHAKAFTPRIIYVSSKSTSSPIATSSSDRTAPHTHTHVQNRQSLNLIISTFGFAAPASRSYFPIRDGPQPQHMQVILYYLR